LIYLNGGVRGKMQGVGLNRYRMRVVTGCDD
jgi:hypothetical protein